MRTQPRFTSFQAREVAELRGQTEQLLHRLIADHQASDARMAAMGRRDPIRTVTGVTALEGAIAAARQMLSDLDERLERLESDITVEQTRSSPTHSLRRYQRTAIAHAGDAGDGGMLSSQRSIAATA